MRQRSENRIQPLAGHEDWDLEVQLQKSQQCATLMAQLMDNVPGMIYQFRMDANGTMSFPYVSSGCREIYEVEPQQVEQNYQLLFDPIHPEDLPRLQEAIATSAQTLEKWRCEWRITTDDGKQKWLKGISKPQLQSDGSILWDGCVVDITERKQAEAALQQLNEELEARVEERTAALRQSEARLQKLTDNIPGMIYEFCLNPDGTVSYPYVSSGCREILGLEPEQIQQDPSLILDCIHPDDLPQMQQATVRSMETLENWECEWRIITQSSQQKWVKAIANPQVQSNDEIIWYSCLVDITEQKQIEQTLLEQEQFLRSFYDGVEHLIFVVNVLEDGEFRYAGWNSPTAKATGISNQDVIDKSPEEAFGSVQGAAVHQRYENCIKAGKAITYEECLNFDGTDTWWLTTINPLKDSQGCIYRLVGTTFNITTRKQTELALKEQTRLSVFRSAINSTLVVNDSLQDILQQCTQIMVDYLDAAFARIWTLNPEENMLELQASAGMYTHIDGPHGRVPVGKYKIGLIAQERQPHLTNSVQTDPRVGDKEWAKREGMVAFAGYPLMVGDELVGVIAMFSRHELSASILQELSFVANEISLGISRKQATTEIQEQAEELKQTLEKLKSTQAQLIQTEKMSGLGQMVAGVAHEINNPANFIHGNLNPAHEYTQDLLGLLELYQQHYPEPVEEITEEIAAIDLDFLKQDLPKLMDSMKEGTRRIEEIVLSLRNFSRLDEAEFKQVDIHEGIDSTLMILHHRLKAKSNCAEIPVFKEYDRLPLVECYPSQINQVLMNILVNAIDVLETMTNPCIHINTQLINNNWIAINIRDNGPGIDQENLTKLFDPFFTTKDVGKGTGLGLSISYQIVVNKHGGKLWCESAPGEGTEFIIQLPILQSPIGS
ncbi:MAG: PAS domain-containing protein [Calothrix sp. MO_167.B12]|nr:PAS domain-containing protein [Calothrix sp. MO_167.B12]